ncbi:unnamed protein product [Rotaria socialis]|uniref:Apple domain-containing protein n=2 Tax=Rotaria socialis TaxID=392032 RepID=A0A817X0A5_9BILA|nr:unnamed protein product [Rotaria socialis]
MSSPAHAIYSSTLSLSLQGHEFQPQYGVQLIFNTTTQSLLLCAATCSQNPSCRIFDYDSSSHRCRLFEADLTNGAIIAVASQTSIVGSVILSASLYASMYNQSCSACQENRYQTCSSTTSTCQCPGNSYWNGSMCPLQLFENATCSQIDACRSDLNLSCIINSYNEFTQCLIGMPKSTTAATVTAATATAKTVTTATVIAATVTAAAVTTATVTATTVTASITQCRTIFTGQKTYSTGSGPRSLSAVDVNGDGKLDIIVANYVSKNVSVLLNTGDGTFAAQTTYLAGTGPAFVPVADVNGDGKPDIIVTNYGSKNLSVLLNTGNGTFAAQTTYSTGTMPNVVVAADVNGDGKPDIIVANYGSNNVGVLIN